MASASLTTPRALDGVEIHPSASQLRVEPRDDPIEANAQALRWDRYPDPHGEPTFGIQNCLLRGSHNANRR